MAAAAAAAAAAVHSYLYSGNFNPASISYGIPNATGRWESSSSCYKFMKTLQFERKTAGRPAKLSLGEAICRRLEFHRALLRTSWNSKRTTLRASVVEGPLAEAEASEGPKYFLPGPEADGVPAPTETRSTHETRFNWNAQWYPVAPAAELDRRAPHAVTIMGRDLVVWWDGNGNSWQVFEDKCPHRLAPLSEGRINEQGELQCSYHGWSFAPCTGACTRIPQAPLDGIPVWESKLAYAGVYPSIEQQGIIWFWLDTRLAYKGLPASKPPFISVFSDLSFSDTLSMRNLSYGYEQLIENLMDVAHVPFAHHGLEADRKHAGPLQLKVEKFDKSGFTGVQNVGPAIFTAPCIWELHISFPFPQSKGKSNGATVMKKVVMVFICIPVSPGKSRLIWSFPRSFSGWPDYVTPKWLRHMHQMLVLDSDLYLLHAAERNLEEAGGLPWEKVCYMPTTSDTFVITFRKWLRVYAGGAPDWGGRYNGQLPPVAPRDQLMDRYHSHVVMCNSCRSAMQFFQGQEIFFQALSVGCAAILGAAALMPIPCLRSWSTLLVFIAVVCSLASRWLSHFIKKTFHFHDYNHAFVK